jgi:hypothetical protein
VSKRGRFVPYVAVDWYDSHTQRHAWNSDQEVNAYHSEPIVCTTVGMLVKRDKRGITIAMSVNSQGQMGGLWHVPAGMIRRVHRLKARS